MFLTEDNTLRKEVWGQTDFNQFSVPKKLMKYFSLALENPLVQYFFFLLRIVLEKRLKKMKYGTK